MRNCCISFLTNTLKIHGSFKQRKLAIASFYLQLKKAQLAFKNVKLLAKLLICNLKMSLRLYK